MDAWKLFGADVAQTMHARHIREWVVALSTS
jgi:hypothetical protein